MFDPTLPQEGTPLDAVQMRSQLNGLKALIDAILTISDAQVDSTTTLNPGEPATASANVSGNTLHFTFAIPQGQVGNAGPQGPAFATAVVDSVTTLNPGEPATVNVSFDGTLVHFSFSIPRGNDGATGAQGLPGEVTLSDLNNAMTTTLGQTSNNTNGVSPLSQVADASYNAVQIQDLISKVDELIAALRR